MVVQGERSFFGDRGNSTLELGWSQDHSDLEKKNHFYI